MTFSARFSETRLEREHNRLRLVGNRGEILVELKGYEIDEAVRAGFLDRDNVHFTLFEYARMRTTVRPLDATGGAPSSDDRSFLSGLRISWD